MRVIAKISYSEFMTIVVESFVLYSVQTGQSVLNTL